MTPLIEIHHLSHCFDVPVLHDISFNVYAGETLALCGSGGSGKSLILKAICGLFVPKSGTIRVGETVVTQTPEYGLREIRSQIGMIFQQNALFDDKTIFDNIAYPLRRRGVDETEIESRVHERLADVELPNTEHLYPKDLSGGMQKRVSLARATIHEPCIMLCDDPTAGLDPVTTSRIFRLLDRIKARNHATMLIASHEIERLSERANRLVLLERGEMRFEGTFQDGLSCHDTHVKQFLQAGGLKK